MHQQTPYYCPTWWEWSFHMARVIMKPMKCNDWNNVSWRCHNMWLTCMHIALVRPFTVDNTMLITLTKLMVQSHVGYKYYYTKARLWLKVQHWINYLIWFGRQQALCQVQPLPWIVAEPDFPLGRLMHLLKVKATQSSVEATQTQFFQINKCWYCLGLGRSYHSFIH